MCRVSSFLGCLGLQTGVKIIATLHLTSSLCMMTLCAYWAACFREYQDTVENEDGLYTYWYRAAVVVAVLSSAHVLLALMLFVGVTKRRPMLLLMWGCIMSVLCAVSLMWLVFRLLIDESTRTLGGRVLNTIEAFAFYGLLVYSITCVYSYYRFLNEDQSNAVEDSEVTKPL